MVNRFCDRNTLFYDFKVIYYYYLLLQIERILVVSDFSIILIVWKVNKNCVNKGTVSNWLVGYQKNRFISILFICLVTIPVKHPLKHLWLSSVCKHVTRGYAQCCLSLWAYITADLHGYKTREERFTTKVWKAELESTFYTCFVVRLLERETTKSGQFVCLHVKSIFF